MISVKGLPTYDVDLLMDLCKSLGKNGLGAGIFAGGIVVLSTIFIFGWFSEGKDDKNVIILYIQNGTTKIIILLFTKYYEKLLTFLNPSITHFARFESIFSWAHQIFD